MPGLSDGCDLSALLSMLEKVNDAGFYFKRVEMVTSTSVRASITDTLLCQGDCVDIAENVESIKAAVYDLGQRGVSRGVIYVSGDGYAAFQSCNLTRTAYRRRPLPCLSSSPLRRRKDGGKII